MAGKSILAVGLDAGSWTRCAICVVEQGRLRYVSHAEVPSQGWVKGRISDQAAVRESMLAALVEAECRAQLSVEQAVVGVGGATVRGGNSRSYLELGRPREIEQRDVNRLIDRASRVQLQEDRMVLQLFPQDFVVDDQPGHRYPRSMTASRFEVNVHLITASALEHTCLVAAVNQAHVEVEETVFEPLAACYAAVLPDDRREGVALVEIGAQSTGLVIYYGDALQLASSLPLSGDHFTRDVARGLCISFEDAELVKREFGCVRTKDTAENSFVEVPSPEARALREVRRRTLNQILEARAVELFQFVRRELTRVGMERSLIGGVFLSGGGAKLSGMCDVAEEILGCQAQLALPVGIQNWPDEISDPTWATAAGLAMYSGRLKMQGEIEKQSVGLLGRILR